MLIQLEAPEGTPVFFQVGGERPPPPRRDASAAAATADAVRYEPDARPASLDPPRPPRSRRVVPLLAASACAAVAFFAGVGVGRSSGGGAAVPAGAASSAAPAGHAGFAPAPAPAETGLRREARQVAPSPATEARGQLQPPETTTAPAEVPAALRRAMEAPPAVLSPPGAAPPPGAAAGVGAPRDAFGLEAPRR